VHVDILIGHVVIPQDPYLLADAEPTEDEEEEMPPLRFDQMCFEVNSGASVFYTELLSGIQALECGVGLRQYLNNGNSITASQACGYTAYDVLGGLNVIPFQGLSASVPVVPMTCTTEYLQKLADDAAREEAAGDDAEEMEEMFE